MKTLIVIDMQNDFISGSLGTSEAQAIVKKVKTKINQAVKNKDAVLFTRDTHGADYLDTQEGKKLPVPHCIRYTSGWQIEKSLQIPDVRIFDKNTFGSLDFGNTLKAIWEEVTAAGEAAEGEYPMEVDFTGFCTGICVLSNVVMAKAFVPEARVCVIENACACVTPQTHQTAIAAMGPIQVDVI